MCGNRRARCLPIPLEKVFALLLVSHLSAIDFVLWFWTFPFIVTWWLQAGRADVAVVILRPFRWWLLSGILCLPSTARSLTLAVGSFLAPHTCGRLCVFTAAI